MSDELDSETILADVEGADEILARAREMRNARPPEWQQSLRKSHQAPRERPTDREIEVIDVISHGLTNEEAGALLYLSAHTIASHLKHATRKLGARDRTHVVALAIRRGLIPNTEGES